MNIILTEKARKEINNIINDRTDELDNATASCGCGSSFSA
jgi:Fe-S cluster assembly iron-binding protein IscA